MCEGTAANRTWLVTDKAGQQAGFIYSGCGDSWGRICWNGGFAGAAAIRRKRLVRRVIPKETRAGNSVVWGLGFLRSFFCGKRRGGGEKTAERALQVGMIEFDTEPAAVEPLGDFTSDTAAGEGIKNKITGVCEHANEVLGQFGWVARWMGSEVVCFAVAEIGTITFSIRNGEQVWGDGGTVVNREFIADIVTRGAFLRAVALLKQFQHTGAVWLQDAAVRGTRPGRFGEPPYGFDGIFDTDAAHGNPFSGRRQAGGVPPKELLCEVKADVLAQHNSELKMIEAARRDTLVPRATDIKNKTARRFEHTEEGACKGRKPLKVAGGINIAVILFSDKAIGRTGHYEIDTVGGQGGEHIKTIAEVDGAEGRAVKGLR